MPRYKLTIEYDGSPFVGWQRQENGPSVQGALEAAATRFTGEQITVQGAGRTDAGVHAHGQVAHIDLSKERRTDVIRDAMNAHLRPQPIAVLEVAHVDDEFHARFDAKRREYLYLIVNRRPPLTLERGTAWHVILPLDADAMHSSAQALAGNHDFSTFRDAQCQAKTPVKTLDEISVSRYGDGIEIRVAARSFLHRQVRSIAGSLKMVGDGSWPEAQMAKILRAKNHASCGPVAPAHGLYLHRISYE